MKDHIRRLIALTHKEFLELVRDKSSILMGVVLPILLVLLIGFGISLDVTHARITVVMEDMSPTAHDVVSFLDGSEYFDPVYVTSFAEAEQRFDDRKTDAILRIPPNFTSDLYNGDGHLQLILYGVDTTTAMTIQSYVELGVASWAQKQLNARGIGTVTIENRLWFNDAHSSTWYFVPGLLMLVITVIGVLLTAIVMAREYERGTFESLFVTPVKPWELIISKIIPYFCVSMLGVCICFVLSRYLFQVPIMGSLVVILLVSMIYLVIALGVGLFISTLTKNQFLACQIALVVSFMPCLMLSGFIFDLRSTPEAVQIVGNMLPYSHYLICLKSLFLAGNIWSLVLKNTGILVLFAIFFLGLAFSLTKKKVE